MIASRAAGDGVDMGVALGRLLKDDSTEEFPEALIMLNGALDSRLARAINLVNGGDGEE